ncbi:alpha/beta-hydrolase [Microthyrium microscopicum]|uniref:Alpha/beta-hydrolase n=1 Tax=Microthyrium microscopicum TaxID=703497 RepID=A0A6A6U4J6_9PEZI|nr:alpha/beta-hydrolase [Microthyrium microscopicum]
MKIIAISTLVIGAVSVDIILQPQQTCTQKLMKTMIGDMVISPVPMNLSNIPTGCSDFEVLIARGGSEPDGPNGKFGMAFGDQFMAKVSAMISGARGYPVQYAASTEFDKDGIIGRDDVINRIRKQSAACPNQKFALTGISAGSIIVHMAAAAMPANLTAKVVAIVPYGNPAMACPEDYGKIPSMLMARWQENCSKGDNTCDKNGNCHGRHMDYMKPLWMDRGAKFIVAAFKGMPIAAEFGKALMLEPPEIAIQDCGKGMMGMEM